MNALCVLMLVHYVGIVRFEIELKRGASKKILKHKPTENVKNAYDKNKQSKGLDVCTNYKA